jgi:hypothetical protein
VGMSKHAQIRNLLLLLITRKQGTIAKGNTQIQKSAIANKNELEMKTTSEVLLSISLNLCTSNLTFGIISASALMANGNIHERVW